MLAQHSQEACPPHQSHCTCNCNSTAEVLLFMYGFAETLSHTTYMTSMFGNTSAHSGGKVPCTGESHLLNVFHGVKSFIGMSAVLP